MACKAREAMVKDIAKSVTKELIKASKDADVRLTGPQIKAKAREAAEKIVDKANALARQTPAMAMTEAVRANASTEVPLPKDKQATVTMSKEVQLLQDEFNKSFSNEAYAKLLNAEIAHGYRNAKGESLVKLRPLKPVLGSKDIKDEMTNDEVEEYFYDTDGTMRNSYNVNETLKQLDKANLGDNYDEAQSARLDNVLQRITTVVEELQNTNTKIKWDTLTGKEAQGQYNTVTGEIQVEVDTDGPGADFRNKFTMTNQEVYVHELVHAAMDFMFDDSNRVVSKDTETIALVGALKKLYKVAREHSTWESLLPGYSDGSKQYSSLEIEQAKAKWKYIFENTDRHGNPTANGLHEFMAGILTNEMFNEAMQNISALSKIDAEADEKILDMIHRLFLNLMAKIAGFATGVKDESISDAGANLIFDIMRANRHAADKASKNQAVKMFDATADITAKAFDKADEHIKKITDPILGVFDSAEKIEGLSDKERAEEMIALRKEVKKIIGDVSPGSNYFTKIINIITISYKMTRVLPKINRAKGLIGHTEEAKKIAAQYAKMYNDLLTGVGLAEDGFIRSAIGDFLDKPGLYTQLTDAILKLTQSVDNVREKAYENVLGQATEFFGDVLINNDRLNVRNNEALTDVVLRTDIQSLGLDSKSLQELLRDPSKVDNKIKELSKGLSASVLRDTKSLANYMVTGKGLITNAKNIVLEFGQERKQGTIYKKEDIKQVDQLASYIALKETSDSAKSDMLDFLSGKGYDSYKDTLEKKLLSKVKLTKKSVMTKEEYVAQVQEGVDKFILLAHGLQVASAKELEGNPHNIIKGYIKETYNNDISLEFFPLRDRKQKENEGYTFIRETGKIPGSTTKYGMFLIKNTNVNRANGAFGLQDKKSRGYTLLDIINAESDGVDALEQLDSIQKAKKFKKVLAETTALYKADRLEVNMHPMYDQYGDIINFRVTMDHAEKKKYLEMETRGTQNLARSYSTMGTAAATDRHNKSVMDMLFEDYEANYELNKEAYVEIRPSELSAEAFGLELKNAGEMGVTKYEQMWARLPRGTKEYAKEKFGKGKDRVIIIKKEMLEAAFGDDDLTAANSALADKMSVKTRAKFRIIEKLWQDLMQIAKGNIVIKTPEVLFGNLVSNVKLLAYTGVHPIVGFKLLVLGAKELKRYEADKKELGILLRNEQAGMKINKSRVMELTEDIKSNSVAPLIDAGLYQSIVEDVSTIQDNNRVANWANEKTDKYITNETANTVIQYLFMTQKTKPFQQMLKATQVSDFYFRYAQYYNAIENKGQSKKQALREAIDNYINYEAPLNKYIRYGDKMGPFFFIRYFTRIQRVVKRIVKDNPSRVGADVALQTFVTGDTSDVLDGSILDKGISSYNPFKVFERVWEVVSPSGVEMVAKVL